MRLYKAGRGVGHSNLAWEGAAYPHTVVLYRYPAVECNNQWRAGSICKQASLPAVSGV